MTRPRPFPYEQITDDRMTSEQYRQAVESGVLQGNGKKGNKKRDDAEFRLCCVVADNLRFWERMKKFVFCHFPSGENRNEKTGARIKRMGGKRGKADYLFEWADSSVINNCCPHCLGEFNITIRRSRHGWIEMKAPGKHQSDDQKKEQKRCDDMGIPYAVCRSWDEVEATMKDWGAL